MSRLPLEPLMPGRILLVHGGALGDFLLALHLVAEVRASGAVVGCLSRGEHGALAQTGGFLGEWRDIEGSGFHLLHAGEAIPPNLAGVFQAQNAVLISSAHPAPAMLRGSLQHHTKALVAAFDPRPEPNAESHITEQWQGRIADQGISLRVSPVRLDWPEAEILRLAARLQWKPGAPRVLMHPGSGGSRKNWPLEHFIVLARRLRNEAKADVRFLAGPVEMETWPQSDIQRLRNEGGCVDCLPLSDAAALIAGVDLFIGNDSGATHLAAALGRPTLAIFGATDPCVWRPLGAAVGIAGGLGRFPDVAGVFLKACDLFAIVNA